MRNIIYCDSFRKKCAAGQTVEFMYAWTQNEDITCLSSHHSTNVVYTYVWDTLRADMTWTFSRLFSFSSQRQTTKIIN